VNSVDIFQFLHKNTVDEIKNLHKKGKYMQLPKPNTFHTELTHERLTIICNALLTVLSDTEQLLSSEFDDGYTRGCAIFGRQKNSIKQIANSGRYPWLSLVNGGNDLVFRIGAIPCRFSNDDPDNPQKIAVLVANRYQMSFFEDVESGAPCRFCFVIARGDTENEDARVVFMGFNAANVLRCKWVSDSVRTIHAADLGIPKPAEIQKPVIGPKKNQAENDETAFAT
jgi:hypothetical protein